MADDDDQRGLLLVMMEVLPEHEADFNRWYNEEHLPERLSLPGFAGARRFVAVEGQPKYLALYDLDSVEAVRTPSYRQAYGNPTPWTSRTQSRLTANVRNVYRELPTGPA
jgi:hypothetical protein